MATTSYQSVDTINQHASDIKPISPATFKANSMMIIFVLMYISSSFMLSVFGIVTYVEFNFTISSCGNDTLIDLPIWLVIQSGVDCVVCGSALLVIITAVFVNVAPIVFYANVLASRWFGWVSGFYHMYTFGMLVTSYMRFVSQYQCIENIPFMRPMFVVVLLVTIFKTVGLAGFVVKGCVTSYRETV